VNQHLHKGGFPKTTPPPTSATSTSLIGKLVPRSASKPKR